MRRSRRGFTLLEVLMAAGLLVVASLGTLAAINSSALLRVTSGETMSVSELLNERAEHLRGVDKASFATSLTTPVTQVAGHAVSGSEGSYTISTGALRGTTVVTTILAEDTASALFPADRDGDGTPGEVPEDSLDLDGDGTAGEAAADSTQADYDVMPVQITVTWKATTNGATRTRTLTTIFY